MTGPRGRRGPRRAGTGRPLAHAASRPLPTGRVSGAGSRPEPPRAGRRSSRPASAAAPARARRPLFTGRAVLLGALVLLLALTLAGPIRQYLAGSAELTRLTAEGAALEERIAELEVRREQLADPAVRAREARERLLLVQPGDRVVVVVDENEAQGDAGTVPDTPAEPSTWYDALLGSVAAADDVPRS